MLFSMIVVITSWAPVFAFSTPGMPPQKAPPSTPARVTRSSASGSGHVGDPRERADPRGGGGPDEELTLGADVEQAGSERERHRQRRRR